MGLMNKRTLLYKWMNYTLLKQRYKDPSLQLPIGINNKSKKIKFKIKKEKQELIRGSNQKNNLKNRLSLIRRLLELLNLLRFLIYILFLNLGKVWVEHLPNIKKRLQWILHQLAILLLWTHMQLLMGRAMRNFRHTRDIVGMWILLLILSLLTTLLLEVSDLYFKYFYS